MDPAAGGSPPNSARIWNYWLGGTDYSPADRAVGEQVEAMFPQVVQVARAQRAFLGRAVRYLAADAGIRQFLDVGAGLPTAGCTHEVAQAVAPECAVVYVDNDPDALAQGAGLLGESSLSDCAYLGADMRDTEEIIRASGRTLDFSEPVAVVLMGVLGHVGDDGEARSVVDGLVGPLAPGSCLVLADGVDTDEAGNKAQEMYNQRSPVPYHLRSPERVAAFFSGLALVEPGVVPCPMWRPDADAPELGLAVYGGVGRKAD
jgi:O-methyltransferase involved in polyketide biosynthesis